MAAAAAGSPANGRVSAIRSSITVSADHHWAAKTEDGLAPMRVTTQETGLDDAVSPDGQSFETLRRRY
ncbi:MAG: hypothetical protein JNL87_21070 [Burkholderiaceae bacterium]|nr:hypothetical protein [Burkholderiaceae bacterium]